MLIDPDDLRYLNSKETLARSSLPTPSAEIIDLKWHFLDDSDSQKAWAQEKIERILTAVQRTNLPFIFKN